MRCALVWPPYNDLTTPPLGIAKLLGFIRAKGFEADVVDLNIDLYARFKDFFTGHADRIRSIHQRWCYDPTFQIAAARLAFPGKVNKTSYCDWKKTFIETLLKDCLETSARYLTSKYDVIGVSVTNVSFIAAVAISRMIKSLAPKKIIVWGGPTIHPEYSGRQLRNLDWVDLFVSGRGEEALEMVLDSFKTNTELAASPFYETNGAGWLYGNQLRTAKEPAQWEPALDSILPDFSSFPLHLYDSPHIPVQTSSGCSWAQCTFCCEPDLPEKYSQQPVDKVLEQIARLRREYGNVAIFFVDNCLNSKKNRLKEICRLLPGDGSVTWTCMVRSKNLSKSLLKSMKSAGCRSMFIGLESFSDNVLEDMNKGCCRLDHLRAFRLAREVGIPVEGNFIIGFPTETAADIKKNIDTLQQYRHLFNSCRFNLSPFAVSPGSKIYKHPQKYNVNILDTGSETRQLPESIHAFIPLWNHHWNPLELNERENLQRSRLNHELESLLRQMSTIDIPQKYCRRGTLGLTVFTEDGSGNRVNKKRLSKLQAMVAERCLDICTREQLLPVAAGGFDKLSHILTEMEASGWVATSGNRVVTTIPFL